MQAFADVGGLGHLGIKPLHGEEHQGKVRGMGRSDILAGNAAGFLPDADKQGFAGRIRRLSVAALAGFRQAQVVLLGKLAVDGQIYRFRSLARQAQGKLYPLGGAGHHSHILLILPGG